MSDHVINMNGAAIRVEESGAGEPALIFPALMTAHDVHAVHSFGVLVRSFQDNIRLFRWALVN